MLNPLAIQKKFLPVGGENNGILSLSDLPQSPSVRTGPIMPPGRQTDAGPLTGVAPLLQQPMQLPMQNPSGLQPVQNPSGLQPVQNPNPMQPIQGPTTSSVDDLNIMIDNILKERLKQLFGGIMSIFNV